MDTTNPHPRGRPLKPADLAYPRRKASQDLIRQLLENSEVNSDENPRDVQGGTEFDERDIRVGSENAASEQTPPVSADEQAQEIPAAAPPIDPTYYCMDCEYPVLYGERICDGCNGYLDWKGIENG